mmetsp:Transcript_55349/g.121282  ORF Transcript_55349/g.121282 Transcript_55349/m.121282 type:complete len:143 (-) Transcript_55349:20-448(-)
MVLLFNMFIAIVMASHDQVLQAEEEGYTKQPPNHRLADQICDFVGVKRFVTDPFHLVPGSKQLQKPIGWENLVRIQIQLEGYQEAPQEPDRALPDTPSPSPKRGGWLRRITSVSMGEGDSDPGAQPRLVGQIGAWDRTRTAV